MKVAAITLMLSMAGASALGIKPAKAPMAVAARRLQESLGKFQVDMQSRRLDGHDGSPFDMAAMMKPACQEACPGVKDLLVAFMAMGTKSTTTPPPGTKVDPMAAMQEIMCPHMETITCMGKTDKCKSRRLDAHDEDGGEMDIMGMMGCFCVCPDLAKTMGDDEGRRLDAHGDSGDDDDDASLKAMCANPEGTIGCMTKNTECKSLEAMMEKGMPKEMQGNYIGYLGITCDYEAHDCKEKGDMEKCDGGAAEKEWSEKACEKEETTDLKPCCPVVDKMIGCQGKKCLELSFVMTSMSPDPSAKQSFEQMMKISKACPEAGMPQSKDDVTAIMTASENKMTGADDDGIYFVEQDEVEIGTTISGLKYDELKDDTREALKNQMKDLIAAEINVPKEFIDIYLSAGSVVVTAKVKASEAGIDASAVTSKAETAITPDAIIEAVKKVPDIEKAAEGGSLDNLSASDIKTEVMTVKVAKSTTPAPVADEASAGSILRTGLLSSSVVVLFL